MLPFSVLFFFSPLPTPNNQCFSSSVYPGFALNLAVASKGISLIPLEENRISKYLIPVLPLQSTCIPLNNVMNNVMLLSRQGVGGGEGKERQDLCSQDKNRESKKEHESRHGGG